MFPKKGNNFPSSARQPGRELGYSAAIAAALRAEVGDTHQSVKAIMRWTGANERTVKNWLAGTSGPRGEHLVDLARHSEEVLHAFLRLANREQAIAGEKLIEARHVLEETLRQIDQLTELAKRGR